MATATAKKAVAKKTPAKAPTKKPVKKVAIKLPEVKAKESKIIEREEIYPQVYVQIYGNGNGNPEMTEADAKLILGWQEETDQIKFGAQYMLVDNDGNKVRCYNNESYPAPTDKSHEKFSNRPYYPQISKTWESEVLLKNWKLNGETMIVGKTGMTLSCQHRLVGLILACQEWRKNPDKWSMWDKEPTISCLVVFGIEEDDETINTIDTGKTRTLTDVLFRSELIRDYKESDRKVLANIISFAIKTVADRTGAWVDAFSPKRTHSEMINFLDRHSKILECCKHVFEETRPDAGKTPDALISLGTAAGLMYLMGASATDPSLYTVAEMPTESSLNWDNYDKAADFWVQLIQRKFPAIINVFGTFTRDAQAEDGAETNGGTRAEMVAVIVKAWVNYIGKGAAAITEKALKLTYHVEEGVRTLAECPTVGGIDHGNPKDKADVVPPTPEELEQRKTEVTEAAQEQKANPKKPTKKAGPAQKIKEGDTVYIVQDEEAGVWYGGTLMEAFLVANSNGKMRARVDITMPKTMKGKTEEVDFNQLTLNRPKA